MTEALTDILVSKLMGQSHTLRLMLNRLSVHDGSLELLNDGAVNGVALCNMTVSMGSIDVVVKGKINLFSTPGSSLQSLLLCTSKSEARQAPSNLAAFPLAWCRLAQGSTSPTYFSQSCVPVNGILGVGVHGLHQLINVPTMLGADWHRIRNSIQQIQLLNADGVNFVQDVDDGNVTPRSRFYRVDEVVDSRVAPDGNICGGHFVFAHYSLDFVVVFSWC